MRIMKAQAKPLTYQIEHGYVSWQDAVAKLEADLSESEHWRDHLRRQLDHLLATHDEAMDCDQDGVCAVSPGCQRHWAERNRELVRERDEAVAAIAAWLRESAADAYSGHARPYPPWAGDIQNAILRRADAIERGEWRTTSATTPEKP